MNRDIPHSPESALTYFLQGEERLAQEHEKRERSKLGILRVGSAGCIIDPDGACIGKDPQTALARFLGYQLPTEASRPYFQGGISNEHIWETMVKATGVDYRCEEDIPIVHELPCGTKITGRPDLVIGKEEERHQKYTHFEPSLMIELKACQATKSAAEKLLLEKPSTEHLIQAGTYSMFLGVPAALVYTVNVSGGIGNWFTEREVGRKDVTFGKIEYKLGWEDGKLYYMKGSHRIDTIITQQGILDYYSAIAEMARTRNHTMMYLADVDAEGNILPYNPRVYGDIYNLVDENQSFENWLSDIMWACGQPYLIKMKKASGVVGYHIIKPDFDVESYKYVRVDREIKSFTNLQSARKYLKELTKGDIDEPS